MELDQLKFHKNLNGAMNVLPVKYNLKATDSKREILFDSNNNAIATRPIWIKEDFNTGIKHIIPWNDNN